MKCEIKLKLDQAQHLKVKIIFNQDNNFDYLI